MNLSLRTSPPSSRSPRLPRWQYSSGAGAVMGSEAGQRYPSPYSRFWANCRSRLSGRRGLSGTGQGLTGRGPPPGPLDRAGAGTWRGRTFQG
jgi:hypothetical protein